MTSDTSLRYGGAPAVVVGGTGGIGRAFVAELLEQGSDVALTYRRNHDAAAAHLATATERGRRCFAYALDLRNRGDIEACCRHIADDLGTPSVVVNCAGI